MRNGVLVGKPERKRSPFGGIIRNGSEETGGLRPEKRSREGGGGSQVSRTLNIGDVHTGRVFRRGIVACCWNAAVNLRGQRNVEKVCA